MSVVVLVRAAMPDVLRVLSSTRLLSTINVSSQSQICSRTRSDDDVAVSQYCRAAQFAEIPIRRQAVCHRLNRKEEER